MVPEISVQPSLLNHQIAGASTRSAHGGNFVGFWWGKVVFVIADFRHIHSLFSPSTIHNSETDSDICSDSLSGFNGNHLQNQKLSLLLKIFRKFTQRHTYTFRLA
jgi:hypothetical protein